MLAKERDRLVIGNRTVGYAERELFGIRFCSGQFAVIDQ